MTTLQLDNLKNIIDLRKTIYDKRFQYFFNKGINKIKLSVQDACRYAVYETAYLRKEKAFLEMQKVYKHNVFGGKIS